MVKQIKIFAITKSQLREMLSIDGVNPLPTSSFNSMCIKYKLHEVVDLDRSEFANRKTFWFDEVEKIRVFLQLEAEEFQKNVTQMH